MATIRPNENAPEQEVHYSLPTVDFDLSGDGSYETNDRQVITDALVHPWLAVEFDEVDTVVYQRPEKSVPYKDDVLSAFNSKANDPEEVRKTEEAKYSETAQPLAVEAGLDQGTAEVIDNRVAVTLAAEDSDYSESDTAEGEEG